MQCPHCRHESDDAALECPKCGFALAKWRSQQAQGGQPAPQARPAAKKSSGVDLSVWILLLVATIAVWKLTRPGGDEGAAPAAPAAGESAADAAAPIPEGSWRFAGRVRDLLRESPVKGAQVAFIDWETGRRSEAVTDEEGRYTIDVDIHWKLGYAAELSHPLYRQRYWTGGALAADRKERLRLGLEPAPAEPDSRAYRGTRRKEPVSLDFALFPQDLSDAERQEASQ
ncbi:MAG: hypothetical protein HY926_10525 [Elusimicrobia bacterium]|nr:hypothetical protein [Elusimicrobiota bacterium]